jgi:flavin-binding protein dodecin
MADPVYQKIQLVGTSSESFKEAVVAAVAKAAETVRNPAWFEVVEHRGSIVNGKIQQFQAVVQVGCKMD